MRTSRRAGCQETGLSGSREAERTKDQQTDSIPFFYLMVNIPIESGRPRQTLSSNRRAATDEAGG